MKKTLTNVVLFTVLGTLAVSCQKEVFVNQPSAIEVNTSVYRLTYSIDGATQHLTLVGEDAWHDFLHWMITLAEEGHRVSFRNEEAASQDTSASTKEVVTYTTNNHDEAYKWANKMIHNGYDVSIEYDERTGIYTCTATRPDRDRSQNDTCEFKS